MRLKSADTTVLSAMEYGRMYKYANMNLIYQRYSLEYFLDSTLRLGLQDIELWGGEPHLNVEDATPQEIGAIGKAIRDRGLNLVCFTPEQCAYPINLAAGRWESRRRSIEYFKKCIEVTGALDCPMLLVSAGYGLFSEPKEEAWKRAVESMQEVAREAEAAGITLVLEPFYYPYTNVLTDLATTKRMLAEVGSPCLKPMVDTACMVLTGDSLNDYAAAFGKDLVHVHFVDGNDTSSAHLAWGEGMFPLEEFQDCLKELGYEGHLTLELIGTQYLVEPEKAVQKSVDHLQV
ncbi:TIM barrel protein [Ammoniphilus sp. YIM 78166]|uniref:TIM barrel protein n=1 Tax=Ammoniphilus sp. YIM 78166 TaxID=1644106 RepID=UPI001F1052E3|nr:TIM barrel protein [Ammoniphilus sp. YIM 78166]